MRRWVLICVVGGVAVAIGAVVLTGSARGKPSPQHLLLSPNDRLEIAGAAVTCRVVSKGAATGLGCYRETKPLSYAPLARSYALELTEAAVRVVKVGSKKAVFGRRETPPNGAPVGRDQARLLTGGLAHLFRHGDKVFVAGTNIVCRTYGKNGQTLLCVQLGSDGHIHNGTYLSWISNSGVLVAQARNGKAVKVFERVHGT
jgi:hypothetical protein